MYKIITLISLFAFIASITVKAQKENKLTIEVLNATLTNSKKHFNYNTNERWYFEGRVGYRFNHFFETSVSVGYQERDYLYFARFNQPAYREVLLIMKRNYIPVAINGRLYLSDFFHEKLHVWKNKDKWDVYMQISLATIKGNDVNDPNEKQLVAQGAFAPYYLYPYVDVYDHLQVSYVAGVRYNFSKHIGLFIEGGEGLLMNGLIGLSANF